MVDCAEGTARQFEMQPRGRGVETLRAQRVTKLFVTHMHGTNSCFLSLTLLTSVAADHVMGIVPFLRHILFPPAIVDGSETVRPTKPVCGVPTSRLDLKYIALFFQSSLLVLRSTAQLAYAPLSARSLR